MIDIETSNIRMGREEFYIELIKLISRRGTCPRLYVGCAIIRDGRIIATGYNGSAAGTPHCTEAGCITGHSGGCVRTVHAEAGAISFAAKHGISLSGSSIYITHSPCLDCAKLIVNAGIWELNYIEKYRDESGIRFLYDSGIKVFNLKNVGVQLEL